MSKEKSKLLLDLDVEKLFEQYKIEDIVNIEKQLDEEILKKREELRSMVGDRYKDVLVACDAIKNMELLSENIVDHIQNVTSTCENLQIKENTIQSHLKIDKNKIEERQLIIQIRLVIYLNEEIWISLDENDNLKAVELFLLSQYIHNCINFSNQNHFQSLKIIQLIKANLLELKSLIIQKIYQKLESKDISVEEANQNLNALMLLQNYNIDFLLDIFINIRTNALNNVINSSYSSVRIQISAMIKCIIKTIHLLNDCFKDIENNEKMKKFTNQSSLPTLKKLILPITPLITYIPDTIKEFKPKFVNFNDESIHQPLNDLNEWLDKTKITIENGLSNMLTLITNGKGLFNIREDALKIDYPENWKDICINLSLPNDLNIWYYFIQHMITQRAKDLLTNKVSILIMDIKQDIKKILDNILKFDQDFDSTMYIWLDDNTKSNNNYHGLSLKSMGYSECIVNLCKNFDNKYIDLLNDFAQYLSGKQYIVDGVSQNFLLIDYQQKYVDREELGNHLRLECTKNSNLLLQFLDENVSNSINNGDIFIKKSIFSARLLQAIINLSPHFNLCCCFNNIDDWPFVCQNYVKSSLMYWQNWINKCVDETEEKIENSLNIINDSITISTFLKWETVNIEENVDEKVLKSTIRIPLNPSLILQDTLNILNCNICNVLPHVLPKQTHLQFIEKNIEKILLGYEKITQNELNQYQTLQFLFDIKYLTILCILRDNVSLNNLSQNICEKFQLKIDPFDFNVLEKYLQSNIEKAALKSQMLLGCLLPCSSQLATLDVTTIKKIKENDPQILEFSNYMIKEWFPLLPITTPSTNKNIHFSHEENYNNNQEENLKQSQTLKNQNNIPTSMRSSAAALFGGLKSDWFS